MPKPITTENVPTWALPYLEYGDWSAMTWDEKEEIDAWTSYHFPRGFVCEYHWDDSGFTAYPLFGKPCETVSVTFYEP